MLSHLDEIEAELFLKDPAADELRLADVLACDRLPSVRTDVPDFAS